MSPLADLSAAAPPMAGKGDLWAKKIEFFRLWLEFLAISPSYELARRFRAGVLTEDERACLPEDFKTVLAVYDDLGDVQRQHFQSWWLERGIDNFGYQGKKPSVRGIAALKQTEQSAQEALTKMEAYLKGAWREQGRQSTLIMAIPIGLSKAQITRQIFDQLDKIPTKKREIRTTAAYLLAGKKLDSRSLFRYLATVWFRARFPKSALWRIGALANVSSTYSKRLDTKAKIERNTSTDDRLALKILTSRALYRGRMIAENAARGVFPSYQPCPHAVDADLKDLNELIVSRRKWQIEQKKSAIRDRQDHD